MPFHSLLTTSQCLMSSQTPAQDTPWQSWRSCLPLQMRLAAERACSRRSDAQVSAAALVAEVQMGEQQLKLPADSCHYSGFHDPMELWRSQSDKLLLVATAGSAADKEGMLQQFMQQVEALLYLAYKLQLPQLMRDAQCISGNTCFNNSLFSSVDVMRSVVSARVVDAAAGCAAAQDAIIASSSTELCAFSSDRRQHVLKPLDLSAEQKQPIKFRAEVVEDLFYYRKGQIVSVQLYLFGESSMTLRLCDVSGPWWPRGSV